MGGLDARYYVAALGGAKHIASITTIGTPHHGSHIADLAIKLSDMAKVRTSLPPRCSLVDEARGTARGVLQVCEYAHGRLQKHHQGAVRFAFVSIVKPPPTGGHGEVQRSDA